MFVEEFGEFSDVLDHGDPGVLSPGMDEKLDVLGGLAGVGFMDEILSWLLRGYWDLMQGDTRAGVGAGRRFGSCKVR